MANPVLAIRVVASTAQAVGELGGLEKSTSKLGRAMDKARPAALGALGGLVALGAGAFNLASEAQQASGAVDSVFGSHAAGVKQMADQASQSVGLAKSEYSQLASVLGSQLKNMGVSQEALGGQTNDLIGLGADLAAQFGGSTSDAVGALTSLLRGERDPIERYGVSISEAAVQAEALAKGLVKPVANQQKIASAQASATVAQMRYSESVKKHGKDSKQAIAAGAALSNAQARVAKEMEGSVPQLTAAQKAQATLSLLSKQTADAQGAFGREANTAAGQQQRATAAITDAGAKIGESLLPVVAAAAAKLAEFGQWAQQNAGIVQGLAIAIGVIAGVILLLSVAQTVATVAQWALNVAMMANPVGLIVLAVIALIAIVVLLVVHWDTVKAVAISVWAAIVAAVQAAWSWLVGIGVQIAQWAVRTWNSVVQANQRAWDMIVALVRRVIATQIAIVQGFLAAARQVWANITGAAQAAWNNVVNAHRTAIATAVGVVRGIIGQVRSIFDQVTGAIRGALNSAVGVVSGIVSRIVGVFDRIVSRAREIAGAVSSVFSGIRMPSLPFAAVQSELTAGYVVRGDLTAAATTPTLDWPTLAAGRGSGGVVTVVNINVTGAMDPPAVARQVRGIINDDARLRGVVPLGGVALA